MKDIDNLKVKSIEEATEIINNNLFKPFNNDDSITFEQRRLLLAVSYLMHALDDYRWYEGELPINDTEE